MAAVRPGDRGVKVTVLVTHCRFGQVDRLRGAAGIEAQFLTLDAEQ